MNENPCPICRALMHPAMERKHGHCGREYCSGWTDALESEHVIQEMSAVDEIKLWKDWFARVGGDWEEIDDIERELGREALRCVGVHDDHHGFGAAWCCSGWCVCYDPVPVDGWHTCTADDACLGDAP